MVSFWLWRYLNQRWIHEQSRTWCTQFKRNHDFSDLKITILRTRQTDANGATISVYLTLSLRLKLCPTNQSKFKHWKLPRNWVKHNEPLIMVKGGINNKVNKREGRDHTQMDKHAEDWSGRNCGVWKLISLTGFSKNELLLFATFEIVLGRHIWFKKSSDFVIQKLFLKFHSELCRVICMFINKLN